MIMMLLILSQQITGPFYDRWIVGKADTLKFKPATIFKCGNNLSVYNPAFSRSYFIGYWIDSLNHSSQRNYAVALDYLFNPTRNTNKIYKYTTPLRSLLRLMPEEGETLKGAWDIADPCLTGLYAGAYHWGRGYVQTMSSLYLHHYNYSGGTVGFYTGLSLDWHVVNYSKANRMFGIYIRRPEVSPGSFVDTLIGIRIKNFEGMAGVGKTYAMDIEGTSKLQKILLGGCFSEGAKFMNNFSTQPDRTIYLVNATMFSVTVTLTNTPHQIVVIKALEINVGNKITIVPSSGTIDGQSQIVIDTSYVSYIFYCDGTNWYILAKHTP